MNDRTVIASCCCRGFTLIELMVTIAIVAILSSVAIPAYSDYVRRGQLPEAFTQLADYRVKMEQYYQDNRNYGAAACADVAGAPTWANFAPTNAKYFGYACALTNAGQGYTITATGSAARAIGHVYTVNHSNAQATTTFKGAGVTKACWMARGDEC
jgi:type IV pilus assembly protein PilE